MSGNILLITSLDDTHRRPLLESQGYEVTVTAASEALARLNEQSYHLGLVIADKGVSQALELCEQMKRSFPDVKIAVLAERAEYVPANECVDAVIREQHSPGRFLAAINKLIDNAGGQAATASLGT